MNAGDDTPPTGAEHGASGRGRILRAARALFTERGYAMVSMQQIADAAGVNKATLYHHFQDKDDLFVAVLREEFDRVRRGIAAELAVGTPLREQLRRVATALFASTRADFGRLIVDLHEHVAEQRRAELRGRCPPPWEILRPAVERAIASGEIRPVEPDLVVELFASMVFGQVRRAWLAADRSPPDARVAAAIVAVLLDGIAARQESEADA